MPTAEDVERPTCKCHGEPMTGSVQRGDWRCAIRNRERYRERYRSDLAFAESERVRMAAVYRRQGRDKARKRDEDRKARGLCVKCLQPLLSEALCWDCLNRMEENRT